MIKRSIVLAILGLLTWGYGAAAEVTTAEEIGSSLTTPAVPVKSKSFMVAAANPYAVEAGYQILKAGGNSIDALVAVQLVLNLVEPQYSGIGGGAFLVYFDAATRQMQTFDGRETAPLQATEDLFLDEAGQPLDFFDAVVGGRSVGVPGTLKLLETVHDRQGSLPWADLFAPAIALATDGFIVSPQLAEQIAEDAERLSRYPSTRAYFFNGDGTPLQAGQRLRNPEFAETLRLIAQSGSEVFYRGDIAADLTQAVQTVPDNPGLLSLADLASYQVVEREPVCVVYRLYEVCGMGPPSSGGVAVGQILGILNAFDLPALGAADPRSWFLLGEATRLAYADRALYLADSDFVPVPVQGLLAESYLQERSQLISPDFVALETVKAGTPSGIFPDQSQGQSLEQPSTTHISIVDAAGNAVSLTSSIENQFGSRLMVRGFLLNNQLTDFSFAPEQDGVLVANRVAPGKRPRSSMAPTLVLQDGQLRMVVGSPGGSRIIGYVVKTIVAHLDWGLNIQEAIDFPHRMNRFGTYDLEPADTTEALATELEAFGYEVKLQEQNSGLHAIVVTPEGLEGGADLRREGMAKGE